MIHLRLPPVAAILAGTLALVVSGTAGMGAPGGESPPVPGPRSHAGLGALHPAALTFPDGPPARVTGGFGEDSCFACHWDGTENDGVGALEVIGFPEKYEPGAEYDLVVSLRHPELVVAGFQLAIRTPSGEAQAGTLGPGERDGARVGMLVDREVQFAHQTSAGLRPSGDGETRWALRWAAPEGTAGPALLHVSAVSGDGDASQMGDHVYTLELESRPGPAQ